MKGRGTSDGIGIGRILVYNQPEIKISKYNIKSKNEELIRLDSAIDKAMEEIDNIYNKALVDAGTKEAEIFFAHKMFLEDPEYIMGIKDKIKTDGINSEWAIDQATEYFIAVFEDIEDDYIRGRINDIKDVSERLQRILLGIEFKDFSNIEKGTIIVAKDLAPSDTAQINKEMVAGIVTEKGGRTSHTSILARSMNIPSVCGVAGIVDMVKDGDCIIINGFNGEIVLNPTEDGVLQYKRKKKDYEMKKQKLEGMRGAKSISKDGFTVELAGNIGTIDDIDKVIENDGEGVGLFRTEFLYLYNNKLPTEEEQFNAYKTAAAKLGNRPLIIRTLDVGGDKEIPYLNIPHELNPFLGYRAIRYCLDNPGIFKTQLRAILRASSYGNIKIMFPMISSLEELRESKKLLEEAKSELKIGGFKFNEYIEVGIMVEIPAVAIHSRQFAKEVDFFSIGTNDLIQYTLAVDRGNQEISYLYNQFHPAVLSLIMTTIENGHKEGIWVGMCGEMAGDERLIPVLLAMGLDEFSMNPWSILKARYIISNTNRDEVRAKLDHILNLPTARDIEEYLHENILKYMDIV
ncbi:MAG: phosphoenolpyruvate--protein phosphotransferase [Tissierellaceae bacterium]